MDDSEYFLAQATKTMKLPSAEMRDTRVEQVLDEVTFRIQFGAC